MHKRSALLLALVLALLVPSAIAWAQQDSGTSAATTATPAAAAATANPNLQIIWPQPITEVHGVIDVVGTANIPDMAFYRLEGIALNDDLSIPENAAWIPLTTDLTAPVTGGVLAQIDTTKVPDGLYELQLAAYTGSVDTPGQETVTTVGPVRVNNDAGGGTGMTPTPAAPAATPTPAADQAPYIVPAGGATTINVRACAVIDNNACPVTGYITAGQTAQILGMSSDGAGWYLVNVPGGLTGWVSATVATAVGNTANIPVVTPPTPFPTPPPAPPAPPPAPPTAVPPTAGYVVPTGIGIQGGGTPQCGQGFNVEVNVANTGGSPAPGGTVTLQDIHVDNGVVTFTGYGNYPSLNPGQNYVVVIPANITAYQNSKHELRASNDGQTQKLRYTLGNGSCGAPPPPKPTPTPTPGQTGGIYNFGPGQCTFALKTNVKYFDHPDGKRLGETSGGGYTAVQGQRVNGTRWYMIEVNGKYVWIRDRDAAKLQKSCRVF